MFHPYGICTLYIRVIGLFCFVRLNLISLNNTIHNKRKAMALIILIPQKDNDYHMEFQISLDISNIPH